MSISLIVTRSIDRNFDETGLEISLDEWLSIVNSDTELRLRTQPITLKLPNGEVSMPARPGQSELNIGGEFFLFLGYANGELKCKLTDEMYMKSSNPERKKIAQIARRLNALITHDEGDEILEW